MDRDKPINPQDYFVTAFFPNGERFSSTPQIDDEKFKADFGELIFKIYTTLAHGNVKEETEKQRLLKEFNDIVGVSFGVFREEGFKSSRTHTAGRQ